MSHSAVANLSISLSSLIRWPETLPGINALKNCLRSLELEQYGFEIRLDHSDVLGENTSSFMPGAWSHLDASFLEPIWKRTGCIISLPALEFVSVNYLEKYGRKLSKIINKLNASAVVFDCSNVTPPGAQERITSYLPLTCTVTFIEPLEKISINDSNSVALELGALLNIPFSISEIKHRIDLHRERISLCYISTDLRRSAKYTMNPHLKKEFLSGSANELTSSLIEALGPDIPLVINGECPVFETKRLCEEISLVRIFQSVLRRAA